MREGRERGGVRATGRETGREVVGRLPDAILRHEQPGQVLPDLPHRLLWGRVGRVMCRRRLDFAVCDQRDCIILRCAAAADTRVLAVSGGGHRGLLSATGAGGERVLRVLRRAATPRRLVSQRSHGRGERQELRAAARDRVHGVREARRVARAGERHALADRAG